jgi:hypothetical protein
MGPHRKEDSTLKSAVDQDIRTRREPARVWVEGIYVTQFARSKKCQPTICRHHPTIRQKRKRLFRP